MTPKPWWLPSDYERDRRRWVPLGGTCIRSAYADVPAMRTGPRRSASTGGHGNGRVLHGHFAVTNQWARITDRSGSFMERLLPGAFSATIARNRDSIRCLFNHGADPSVGNKVLGPLIDLREDDVGAAYAVAMLETSYNADLLPGLAAGQYGASFRFSVPHQRIEQRPKRSEHNPEGLPERSILAAKVREISAVTFPAYGGATAMLADAAPIAPVALAMTGGGRSLYAPRRSRSAPQSWRLPTRTTSGASTAAGPYLTRGAA